MAMVSYLLIPFLPWRVWPLTLDMENQVKQKTRERARPGNVTGE